MFCVRKIAFLTERDDHVGGQFEDVNSSLKPSISLKHTEVTLTLKPTLHTNLKCDTSAKIHAQSLRQKGVS